MGSRKRRKRASKKSARLPRTPPAVAAPLVADVAPPVEDEPLPILPPPCPIDALPCDPPTPGYVPDPQPFFTSRTWTWPVFDDACCQECGRTIPLDETGWVFDELILCEECFLVVEAQRLRRIRIMNAPKPAAIASPVVCQAPVEVSPPAEPVIELEHATAPADEMIEPTSTEADGDAVQSEIEQLLPETESTDNTDIKPIITDATDLDVIVVDADDDMFLLDDVVAQPEPVAFAVAESIVAVPAEAESSTEYSQPPIMETINVPVHVEVEIPPINEPIETTAEATVTITEVDHDVSSVVDDTSIEDRITTESISETVPEIEAAPPAVATVEIAKPQTVIELAVVESQSTQSADESVESAEPAGPGFELTPPPVFEYRLRFADVALIDDKASEATDSTDSIARTSDGADDTPPSMPLFEHREPEYELTTPPPFIPRLHFADYGELDADQSPAQHTTEVDVPDVYPLFDAMQETSREPAFTLTEPPPFAPRHHFVDFDLPEASTTVFTNTSDESTPLFDVTPQPQPTADDSVVVNSHAHADAAIESPATAPTPVEIVPAPRAEEAAASEQPSNFLDVLTETESSSPTTAPASEQKPAATPAPPSPAKSRARKRPRTAPSHSPPPAPLIFQHPVDALLHQLHHEHVDAQIWQKINQWRASDPYFNEIDAVNDAAISLRDQWMQRQESKTHRRSSTG